MFVSTQNLHIKSYPRHQGDGIRRWDQWETIEPWGQSPHEWDRRPYETPESPLPPSATGGHGEETAVSVSQGVGPQLDTKSAGALMLDFQS